MPRFITESEGRAMLREKIGDHGGRSRVARDLGLSGPTISLAVHGRRQIGPRLAEYLGLIPVSGFFRKAELSDSVLVRMARGEGLEAALRAYETGLTVPVLRTVADEYGVDTERELAGEGDL